MRNSGGRSIQLFIAFLVFMISGLVIFNPIYNSLNIAFSVLLSVAVGTTIFEFYLFIYKRFAKRQSRHLIKLFSILSCVFSIICTIIYLTQIIKDISHIAGRGISLAYYSALAFAILSVSYYLCYNTEKGIFRFSLLSLSAFILFFFVILLSFTSTKHLFWQDKFPIEMKGIASGILTGLFFTFDIPVFFGTFQKYIYDENQRLHTRPLRLSFLCAVIFLSGISIFPYLIFGKGLVLCVTDPIFCATKLFPSADMTEIGSVVKIIGFMIKSSVYINYSSSKICSTFRSKKHIKAITILCLYISIPAVFLTVSLLDKSLEYGAFQHMIYCSVICLGIFCTLSYFFSKNQS